IGNENLRNSPNVTNNELIIGNSMTSGAVPLIHGYLGGHGDTGYKNIGSCQYEADRFATRGSYSTCNSRSTREAYMRDVHNLGKAADKIKQLNLNTELFRINTTDGSHDLLLNPSHGGGAVFEVFTAAVPAQVTVGGDMTVSHRLYVTGSPETCYGGGSGCDTGGPEGIAYITRVVTREVYNTTGGVHYSSDSRLKNIKGDNKAGLDEINKIEVKNFTFKNDKKKKPHVGVIAQQLQKVFPNSVTKGEDGYLFINTDEIFYAMVNSIKQLYAKFQELTAKVTGLDKRLTELEAQNKLLKEQNEQIKKQNVEIEKRLTMLEKTK
ncbi:tail fiber domain-containing protein, partial [bacterium]|nr:tail fiber domain-containing protein [bacterium]